MRGLPPSTTSASQRSGVTSHKRDQLSRTFRIVFWVALLTAALVGITLTFGVAMAVVTLASAVAAHFLLLTGIPRLRTHKIGLLALYGGIVSFATAISAMIRVLGVAEETTESTALVIFFGGALLFALHHGRTKPPSERAERLEVIGNGLLLIALSWGYLRF